MFFLDDLWGDWVIFLWCETELTLKKYPCSPQNHLICHSWTEQTQAALMRDWYISHWASQTDCKTDSIYMHAILTISTKIPQLLSILNYELRQFSKIFATYNITMSILHCNILTYLYLLCLWVFSSMHKDWSSKRTITIIVV